MASSGCGLRPRRSAWWVGILPLALAVLALGCASHRTGDLRFPDVPVIDLAAGAVEILPGTGVLDSPVLSADGNRLAVQVEVYEDPLLPYEIYSLGVAEKDDSGTWRPVEIVRKGVYRRFLGHMEMPVQPSFDETGERIVLTQIEFDSVLRIPWRPSVRSWVERIPWKGGTPEPLVEYWDWAMKPTELLQHARVSPDGRWLTFYTRVHEHTQGVYLLDLRTGQHYRLSDRHDKHPTWSPDGRRIYFHTTFGGKRHRFDFFARGIERSILGFFELDFADGELVRWHRRLLDDADDRFIYHKHPTEVAGTGLLFFHGRLDPDGNMKLMVRLAEPGSDVFVVRPRWNEKAVKAAKHPCSSHQVADLVFIAKPKGEKDYRLMMALTDEALKLIAGLVGGDASGVGRLLPSRVAPEGPSTMSPIDVDAR